MVIQDQSDYIGLYYYKELIFDDTKQEQESLIRLIVNDEVYATIGVQRKMER